MALILHIQYSTRKMERKCSGLSREMADEFLMHHLKLEPETVKSALHAVSPRPERLQFLNEIISAFYERIPFQNMVLLSTPLECRQLPDVEFIINEVLSGEILVHPFLEQLQIPLGDLPILVNSSFFFSSC